MCVSGIMDTHSPRFQLLEVRREKEPGCSCLTFGEHKVFVIVNFFPILNLNLVQRTKHFSNGNIQI